MEEPAMEILTRSRNAIALNTNSQNTRTHRVWPIGEEVIRVVARSLAKRSIQALWALNSCSSWLAIMRSSPGCNIKEFIDKPWSEALRMMEGSDFLRIALASFGVTAI